MGRKTNLELPEFCIPLSKFLFLVCDISWAKKDKIMVELLVSRTCADFEVTEFVVDIVSGDIMP